MKLRKKRKPGSIPLSAMGDIAFLLLVFYVATTMVTDQRPLELDLPEVDSGAMTSPYPLIIYVNRELAENNNVYFFNENIALSNLSAALREKATTAPSAVRVYLNIEKDVPYRSMNQIIDELKEAEIRNLIITTTPEGN